MKEDGKNLRRSLNLDKHGNLVDKPSTSLGRTPGRPITRYILCHNRALTSSLAARQTLEGETENLRKDIESNLSK